MARATIVVPTYNHEEYVVECLLSLEARPEHDCALVLIDDCSSDNTLEVALSALDDGVAGFSSVHALRNDKNLGAAATINKAIRMSDSDIVFVINSDDLYFPGRISDCLAATDGGAEFVFSDVRFVGETSRNRADCEIFQDAIAGIDDYPSVSTAFLACNRAISTGNFCFSRAIYELVGGFKELRYCHDWEFALSCALRTEPVFIRKKLYGYRLHERNSYRALAETAVSDTRECYRHFFSSIGRGCVQNRVLREIVGADKLWEALVREAGPLAIEEWNRVANGLAHS